ncbi:hypothetical protein JTE90_017432 [Oedothorax gibbosus]|uniref:Uncharacterized protein n=1 Tax=Oedothorax gibbosus TaxID=931172 RepID=A0AAV6TS36_9ARAC|nr:hypothetical protein JTE90_017432 [Oedothorax gibbosus]
MLLKVTHRAEAFIADTSVWFLCCWVDQKVVVKVTFISRSLAVHLRVESFVFSMIQIVVLKLCLLHEGFVTLIA